jgi:arylsulfatase
MFNGNLNIIRDKGIGYELFGNRAYIKDEWKIVGTVPPFGTGEFELYNLKKDPFERTDLSAKRPDKREELIGLWNDYANRVGVVYDPVDVSQIKMKE